MASELNTSLALVYARSILGKLPAKWRYARVGDLEEEGLIDNVQDGNHGESHPKSSDYVAAGVPFVMAKDIIHNRLDLSGCNFITREQADSLRIGFARPGDVLLTHKATMGRVAIVPDGHEYVMLTPQVTYYRIGNRDKLDAKYLKYAFLSPQFQHQLNASSEQSTRKYIGITAQRDLWFPLPPISEQRRIADILGSLDDKIELNRQMRETMETMARRLFKSWFIDFEPVHAKAALRCEHPNLSNAELSRRALPNMDSQIAELFPDKFENCELGAIPKGWMITTLGDETDLLVGFAFKSNSFLFTPTGPRLARGDNVKEGEFFWGDKSRFWPTITPELERYLLNVGDVLVGMDGSKVGKNWARVRESDLPCLLVQRVTRIRPAGSVGANFISVIIGSSRFRDYVDQVKTGTSIPHISLTQVSRLPLIRPPAGDDRLFFHFENAVGPLTALSDNFYHQSQMLERTREKLLPRLLSGELSTNTQT